MWRMERREPERCTYWTPGGMTMVIVGILQNTWAHDPERVQTMLDRHSQTDQRKLRTRLLFGSLTGKRLRDAFGALADRIVWVEACSKIGGSSDSCPPPDNAFLRSELAAIRPDVVLLFGRVAQRAFRAVGSTDIRAISMPHPAKRGTSARVELNCMAGKIIRMLQGCPERCDGIPGYTCPEE